MNWTAGLVGAIVAVIVTGARTPWAPLVGGVLGLLLLERLFPDLREKPKAAFVAPLFELAGGIARADGHVSEAEVQAATRWMQRLGLDRARQRGAVAGFERGRREGWRFEPACDSLRTFTHEQAELRLMVLKLLAEIAAVDAHPAAQALLDAIAERLNVTRPTWDGLRSATVDAALAAEYAELEVTAGASDEVLRAAYRALMARHHPDRLGPEAAPESRARAEEKTRRINAAYGRICRARGLD